MKDLEGYSPPRYEVREFKVEYTSGAKEALGSVGFDAFLLQTMLPQEIIVHDKTLAVKVQEFLKTKTHDVIVKHHDRTFYTADPQYDETFVVTDGEPYRVFFTGGTGSELFQATLELLLHETGAK